MAAKQLPTDYCTISCNTNGYTDGAPLVEVAAVRVRDCRAVAAFRSFIACDRIVIDNLRTNANITDVHLKGAPTLEEAMTGLLEFVGDDMLVGAKYGRFIRPYIERDALAACGVVMGNQWRDVLWKADNMGLLSRDSLTDLCEHLKIKKDPKHRALTDAVATWQCWEAMRLIDQGTKVNDLPDWIYHGDVPVTSLGPDADAGMAAADADARRAMKRVKWIALAVFFGIGVVSYIKPAVFGVDIPYGMTQGNMRFALLLFTALSAACAFRSLRFRPSNRDHDQEGPIIKE